MNLHTQSESGNDPLAGRRTRLVEVTPRSRPLPPFSFDDVAAVAADAGKEGPSSTPPDPTPGATAPTEARGTPPDAVSDKAATGALRPPSNDPFDSSDDGTDSLEVADLEPPAHPGEAASESSQALRDAVLTALCSEDGTGLASQLLSQIESSADLSGVESTVETALRDAAGAASNAQAFSQLAERFEQVDDGESLLIPLTGLAIAGLARRLAREAIANDSIREEICGPLFDAAHAAARTLAQSERRRVRLLPRLVRSVVGALQKHRLPLVEAVPSSAHALTLAAEKVAADPDLARRLARPVSRGTASIASSDAITRADGPYRLRIPGPIEITISRH